MNADTMSPVFSPLQDPVYIIQNIYGQVGITSDMRKQTQFSITWRWKWALKGADPSRDLAYIGRALPGSRSVIVCPEKCPFSHSCLGWGLGKS